MVWFETNVNICYELNGNSFDVYESVNHMIKIHWVVSKVYMNPFGVWSLFTLHATQCCLHFDKPQKKEIHP